MFNNDVITEPSSENDMFLSLVMYAGLLQSLSPVKPPLQACIHLPPLMTELNTHNSK